jgi:ATP-binding cassette, subfamily B, multidrug efflux pump
MGATRIAQWIRQLYRTRQFAEREGSGKKPAGRKWLASVLIWFETRINPFDAVKGGSMPPAAVRPFILFYLQHAWSWLAILFVSSFLLALLESAIILGTGWFVDFLSTQASEAINFEFAIFLISSTLAILILRLLVSWLIEILTNQTISLPLTIQIGWRTYTYTVEHAIAEFQNDFSGRVAERVTQVGSALCAIAVQVVHAAIYVIVYSTVTIAAFSAISPWLGIPIVLWIVACSAIGMWFLPRLEVNAKLCATGYSGLVGCIVDTYTNIMTVKVFAGSELERSAVRAAMASFLATAQAGLRLLTGEASLLTLANTALLISVGSIAGSLWLHGGITPGQVAAGFALVMRLSTLSSWFIDEIRSFFENLGQVRDSMNIIALPHSVVDQPDAVDLSVTNGEIVFRDVHFHYGNDIGVIRGLDLTVRPGEKLGLIGPSGAGKSTLISLLLRLYDCQPGEILIDGQNIANVSQESLRRNIGMVSQEVSLFNRSVRDNIAYGRPLASQAEIEHAAKLARADEFIRRVVDDEGRCGYEAHVGERGARLSGGQRQRIAIARALLMDAPILVLDEATSAMDLEIEAAMRDGLAELLRSKTVIAIAHRRSTLAALTRLAVFDQGRIVEMGTHDELIGRGGIYAGSWHSKPN